MAQGTNLQVAKCFAENYEPHKDGIAKLVEVPAHVVEAFTHLKAEDRSACEKYLALIFIKLYRAHLECCNQSYELRTRSSKRFDIDRAADPLLFEFNSITKMYDMDKPIEFISSAMAYDWVKAHTYLRNDPAIKKEYVVVKKRKTETRQVKFM